MIAMLNEMVKGKAAPSLAGLDEKIYNFIRSGEAASSEVATKRVATCFSKIREHYSEFPTGDISLALGRLQKAGVIDMFAGPNGFDSPAFYLTGFPYGNY